MGVNNYTFSAFNGFSVNGISESLNSFNKENEFPVIICIGSDLILGDSLGPIVGTLLKRKNLNTYIYGTLSTPVTAKEIKYVDEYLKKMHPKSQIIVVDAAVGESDDVGLIRVKRGGIRPGEALNKNLGTVGDVSIIGIVTAKSPDNYCLYNYTRLNLVYLMAEKIAEGIKVYIEDFNKKIKRTPVA